MVDRHLPVQAGFEWRAQHGRWRWLILGALGVAPAGCSGRHGSAEPDTSEVDLRGNGGAAGSSSTPGGGAATGGTASGGSGATTAPSACEPPLTDLGGGWERCGNGMVHRQAIGTCASSVPRPDWVARVSGDTSGVDAGLSGECHYDSDCTQLTYGHCEWGIYIAGTYCVYGCVTDADCSPGYACVCGSPVGECHPATCSTDAECGAGFLCSDFTMDPGCGGQAFACQRAGDACAAASDCGEYQFCARGHYAETIPPDALRYCSHAQCEVGRPFLVAGGPRLAPAVARGDWYPAAGGGSMAASPSPELRAAIRRGWLEQALMEHASVAAFARFSLQLLALGAPAELCSQAARAMQDEIDHARACFDHARRHSDGDVGPGPLDMTGALDATDLQAIVLGTIAEGCIGETVAAIEAAEALAHCEDEAARSTLARIAQDETRHSELAWRFVAWALEAGPAALRERARAAFAEAAQAEAAPVIPTTLDRHLARHGLIAPALRAELRRRVLRDVIEPCAHALFDSLDAPRRPRAEATSPAPEAARNAASWA